MVATFSTTSSIGNLFFPEELPELDPVGIACGNIWAVGSRGWLLFPPDGVTEEAKGEGFITELLGWEGDPP